tara:strand:- start:2749 stop:3333 length:585 start_codon:yes stop_codon:yes gene_type:complete
MHKNLSTDLRTQKTRLQRSDFITPVISNTNYIENTSDTDNFILDNEVVYSRRVSRTVKGGRRSRYSLRSFSIGSNPWTTYIYFGKGKSEHRFKATEKAQGLLNKSYGYQNYAVLRRSSIKSYNSSTLFRYKSSTLLLDLKSLNSSVPHVNTLSAYRSAFIGLFPFKNVQSRFRNTRNKLVQGQCLKKALIKLSE